MSQLTPLETSVDDICQAALKECGAVGMGQVATGEEVTDAWARLQWMLQEWGEDPFMVWASQTITIQNIDVSLLPVDTNMGTSSYPVYYFPVGPGAGAQGGFETGPDNTAQTPTQSISVSPRRLKAVFLRQSQGVGLPIDYPLMRMEAEEDFSRIALKGMVSFPGAFYYRPSWPLGNLFIAPLPTDRIYGLGIVMRQQMPIQFLTTADIFEIPFLFFNAFYTNLAIRLRPHYGIRTGPGDHLPEIARGARAAIKANAAQIAVLELPQELSRPRIYNIFSDRSY